MRSFATALLALATLPGAALAQPVIDGDLSDSQYTTIATGGSGTGFGSNIDVKSIRYYVDTATSMLYIGVTGKLDQGNNNGIGLWLGASGTGSSTGVAAGSALGVNGNGNGHYMGGNGGANANFRADFEVDYMFAVNPGGGANAYLDAARRWGGTTGSYVGNSAGASGTVATGTGPAGGTIAFAFNNGGGATQGLEIRMPLSEIGATTASSITAFAMVVSNDAYFSDDAVPNLPPPPAPDMGRDGAVPMGIRANPGYNANFNSLCGGACNSGSASLPVELTAFAASVNGNAARLVWTTASETNNAGFAVEQQTGNAWTERGFVAGRGTTTERHTYAFDVTGLTAGTHAFRLRQVDTDGTVHYSSVATVEIGVDGGSRVTLLGARAVRVETSEAEAVSVRLFDVLGRMVSEQRAEVSGTVEFAVPSGLSSGAYVVRVEGERFAATRTLVVR